MKELDLTKLTQDEIFAQYKMYWTVLDELCNNGQGESEKAEEIRDKMDPIWYVMDKESINKVNRLT